VPDSRRESRSLKIQLRSALNQLYSNGLTWRRRSELDRRTISKVTRKHFTRNDLRCFAGREQRPFQVIPLDAVVSASWLGLFTNL
jgi:hypothetical protein